MATALIPQVYEQQQLIEQLQAEWEKRKQQLLRAGGQSSDRATATSSGVAASSDGDGLAASSDEARAAGQGAPGVNGAAMATGATQMEVEASMSGGQLPPLPQACGHTQVPGQDLGPEPKEDAVYGIWRDIRRLLDERNNAAVSSSTPWAACWQHLSTLKQLQVCVKGVA